MWYISTDIYNWRTDMTLLKRKLPALIMALAMLISIIPLFDVTAGAAAFSWMNSAKTVKSGPTYSTTMPKSGNWVSYKISVKHDGVLKIDLTAKADYTAIEVCDINGEKVYLSEYTGKTGCGGISNQKSTDYNDYAYWNSDSGKSVTRAIYCVEKGTYYVRFAHLYYDNSVGTEGSGKISFKLTFPTTESDKDDAVQLFSDKTVTVKNSYKNEKQVYVLNVRKAGDLNLNFSTVMKSASVKLYKKNYEDQVEITSVSNSGGQIKSGGTGYEYINVESWTDPTTRSCSSRNYDCHIRDSNAPDYYYKLIGHSHFDGTITYKVNKGIYYLVIENTDSRCTGFSRLVYSDTYYSYKTWEYDYDVTDCSNCDYSEFYTSGTVYAKSKYDYDAMTIKASFADAGELQPAEPAVEPDVTMSIKKGKTLNAAALCDLTGTIKWTTSNKAAATVDAKGKVTAKKAGKTYIKGTSGKKTFVLLLTVK